MTFVKSSVTKISVCPPDLSLSVDSEHVLGSETNLILLLKSHSVPDLSRLALAHLNERVLCIHIITTRLLL